MKDIIVQFTDHNGTFCTIKPNTKEDFKLNHDLKKVIHSNIHDYTNVPVEKFKKYNFKNAFMLPFTQLNWFKPRHKKWERSDGLCYGVSIQAAAFFELENNFFSFSLKELEEMHKKHIAPSSLFFNQLIDWDLAEKLQAQQQSEEKSAYFPKMNRQLSWHETDDSFSFYNSPKVIDDKISDNAIDQLKNNKSIILKISTKLKLSTKLLSRSGHGINLLHNKVNGQDHYCLIDSNYGLFYFRSEQEFKTFLPRFLKEEYKNYTYYHMPTPIFSKPDKYTSKIKWLLNSLNNITTLSGITAILILIVDHLCSLPIKYTMPAFIFSAITCAASIVIKTTLPLINKFFRQPNEIIKSKLKPQHTDLGVKKVLYAYNHPKSRGEFLKSYASDELDIVARKNIGIHLY